MLSYCMLSAGTRDNIFTVHDGNMLNQTDIAYVSSKIYVCII